MKKFKDTIEKFLTSYNTLFSSITKVYFIVMGFFLIGFYLYFRLFRSRSPYLLTDLKEHLTVKIWFFFLVFVIVHFSILLSFLIVWYRNKYKKKPNLFIVALSRKLAKIIDLIYWKPLDTIYIKYHRKIPGSARFFVYLEKSWTDKQRGKYYFYSLIFLFDIIPKIIMATIFFIDVVILNQVKSFFWVAPLVFVPIFFKIFMKLMLSCANNNIPVLTNYFTEITGLGKPRSYENLDFVTYETYHYVVKEEYLDVINPKEQMQYILQLQGIIIYIDKLKTDKEFFDVYCSILTSSLYLIAGIVRLLIFYF